MQPSTGKQLLRDESMGVVQTASAFKTLDGAASPISSPFTLSGGVDVLTRPTNAVEVTLSAVAHDLQVSELDSMANYDLVPAGAKEVFGMSKMPFIYVQGTMGDTLYFKFILI
jgi:hypothetical protein